MRFDGGGDYGDLAGWLELSIERILATLGSATAIEVFSSLYATLDPWEALEHEAIFDALARRAGASRPGPQGARLFTPGSAE